MFKNNRAIALFVFLATLLAIVGCVNSAKETPAGSIPQDKVVLIVNGDDFGVTPAFTDATLDAYLKGMIGSASIVAPGADADRAIELLKKYPQLEIGIHLTLTGDWQPLTSGASLRNEKGQMWNTSAEAAYVDPGEAAVEWEAQIRKIKDAGIVISHLDSHMGCYFSTRELFTAAYTLAKKYAVPLISSFIPGLIPQPEWGLFPLSSYIGIYTLDGSEESLENRTAAYWQLLGNLKPGIHYLFSHQGWLLPGKEITGDLGLRINDYKFWTSAATRQTLAEKGYLMIGSSRLKQEFRKALEKTSRG